MCRVRRRLGWCCGREGRECRSLFHFPNPTPHFNQFIRLSAVAQCRNASMRRPIATTTATRTAKTHMAEWSDLAADHRWQPSSRFTLPFQCAISFCSDLPPHVITRAIRTEPAQAVAPGCALSPGAAPTAGGVPRCDAPKLLLAMRWPCDVELPQLLLRGALHGTTGSRPARPTRPGAASHKLTTPSPPGCGQAETIDTGSVREGDAPPQAKAFSANSSTNKWMRVTNLRCRRAPGLRARVRARRPMTPTPHPGGRLL